MKRKRSRRRLVPRALRLRPYQRVVLIMLVVLTGAGVVVGILVTQARTPVNDLDRVTRRLEPIAARLAAVANHERQATANFFDAMSKPDGSARTIAVQGAEDETQHARKAWNSYRRLALGLPGEQKLQAQYEQENTNSRNLAIGLFTTDPNTAPLQYAASVSALRASGERQQHLLSQLADRVYEPMITRTQSDTRAAVVRMRDHLLLVIGIALFIAMAIAALILHGALRDERVARDRDSQRERQIRRGELEFQVQRGLEMTRTEEDSYSVVGSALGHVIPELPAELLIADSSHAHFRQVLTTGPDVHPCSVSAPTDCPVGQSGQVRVFDSSDSIDACPYLRPQTDGACAAACIPLAVAGRPIGVIHVGAPEHDPPSEETVTSVSLVAQRAGAHIGLLRATARTETEARTDALTGLYNRRSIEAAAHHLVREGTPFVVAFADLDHFKVLNDKHGHETGDRVLRLFARVLRDSVRPTDIPARYGGEEFVVVLPDCSIPDALTVADRLRTRLREAVDSGSVPPFTVSVGIALSGPDNGLTETVGRADEALLTAKAAGRDRVCIFPGDDPKRSRPADHPHDDVAHTPGDAPDEATGDASPPALRLGA